MAQVYNLEPQPTAKVLLNTTSGDIELELFAKQTPLASRNFLQLCLNGYYDGTIFHRLVPGFIIQGGDPTGTGHGGEAIYDGGLFADEFHSRLKFNRRGLLGMANSGKKDDNGSQFFITLAATPELDNHNTMFGRIVGDTIYNLMKMGEADLDDGERPLYPVKITGTEILINPFDDMLKQEPRRREESRTAKKPEKKQKKTKTLLSFMDDDADEAPVAKKPKFNTKLVGSNDPKAVKEPEHGDAKSKSAVKARSWPRSESASPDVTMEPAVQNPVISQQIVEPSSVSPSSESSPEPTTRRNDLQNTNAEIEALKASMRRHVVSTNEKPKKMSALEQMIPATSIRGRKRKQGTGASLELLNQWKTRLETAPRQHISHVQEVAPDAEDDEALLCDLHFVANCLSCKAWDKEANEDEDQPDENWMAHSLSFAKDRLGKDLEWKRKNEEELVVIDPREKERTLLEERKARKKGGHGTDRAWDKRS